MDWVPFLLFERFFLLGKSDKHAENESPTSSVRSAISQSSRLALPGKIRHIFHM
jgi:hypothetical protein